MFTVYFINYRYASERRFDTFEAALEYAKTLCFHTQILRAGRLVAFVMVPASR
jgi:hypothetical protein